MSELLQVIPQDITQLPKYSVSRQYFICTAIALFIFLIIAISFMAMWAWRIYKRVFNPDYIIDYQVKFETVKMLEGQNRNYDGTYNDSAKKQINLDDIPKFVEYNRKQSRILEFICVSVIVAINIGCFTCNILEIAAFVVAFIIFGVFNMFRILDSIPFLRLLWLIPIIAEFVPFYVWMGTYLQS